MIPDLLGALVNDWQEPLASAGLSLKPPLYALKIGESQGVDRKINFLIFSEGGTSPVCIAKTVRSSIGVERLHQEFEKQQALYSKVPDGIPQPIGLFDLFGHAVMLEAAISGQSLTNLLDQGKHRRPKEVQADITAILDWLAVFQERTTVGHIRLADALKLPKNLPEPLQAKAESLLRQFSKVPIPLVGCHGDYWAGNFFWDDGRLSIIDWEDFAEGILPIRDALFFVTTYALSYPWRRWGKKISKAEAFERGFLQKTWLSDIIHQSLATYCDKLGIPTAVLSLLFVHFLSEMASADAHSQARKGLQQRWQQYFEQYCQYSEYTIWD